jgi:hypothetical protein
MATMDRHAAPPGTDHWDVAQHFSTAFRWGEYADGRDSLLKLYAKGKQRQWDTDTRVDWSLDLDPESPEQLPDESIPIFGSAPFARLTAAEKATLRRHFQSWQLSQFLHGEQGALVCTARIVQQVPMMDAKFYAATQVRRGAPRRSVSDHADVAAPDRRRPVRRALGHDVPRHAGPDRRPGARRVRPDPRPVAEPARGVRERVRHAGRGAAVAFGRFALRDYYPELTDRERDEREEFAVEACYLMRDRFQAEEVWATLGLPVDECAAYMLESGFMRNYRSALFSRIVPTIKEIGLWGPRIRRAYADMGILGFAEVDGEALAREDESIAERFDQERRASAA